MGRISVAPTNSSRYEVDLKSSRVELCSASIIWHILVRIFFDSALAYASSSIRKLANSLAAQRGRAGRTPQPTGELTQQGTIFLWISDCSRIISREGKLERRAYFIDGETCRRTQLKEMGSWRDSPGIFQKWLLLVSQAIEYLPLRSNPTSTDLKMMWPNDVVELGSGLEVYI